MPGAQEAGTRVGVEGRVPSVWRQHLPSGVNRKHRAEGLGPVSQACVSAGARRREGCGGGGHGGGGRARACSTRLRHRGWGLGHDRGCVCARVLGMTRFWIRLASRPTRSDAAVTGGAVGRSGRSPSSRGDGAAACCGGGAHGLRGFEVRLPPWGWVCRCLRGDAAGCG